MNAVGAAAAGRRGRRSWFASFRNASVDSDEFGFLESVDEIHELFTFAHDEITASRGSSIWTGGAEQHAVNVATSNLESDAEDVHSIATAAWFTIGAGS